MRSRASPPSMRDSCSSASPDAATRISPRCSRAEIRRRQRTAVVVHVSRVRPGRRAASAHSVRRRRRRHRAGVSRPGRRRGSRPPSRRRGDAAHDAARAAAVAPRARTARGVRDRRRRRRRHPRRREPAAVRSDARHRGARLLALRRGARARGRNTSRPRPRGGLACARHRPRRGARAPGQHSVGTRPRACRLRARGRQAPPAAPRRRSRRRDVVRNRGSGRRVKTLVIYLMAGKATPELAAAAADGGADIIELGFPFSDPLADGPVIRRAGELALAEGMRTGACLECLARTRELIPEKPLVPMTYAALLEAYGWDRFAADAEIAGATSLIVADLPAGERPELRRVQLVAPTSTDERLRLAAEQTDGWLYLVTLTGTTGARAEVSPALAGLVERARAATGKPLYAGFGISSPEQAPAAAELADGVVVGSRAVEVAEEGPDALGAYVADLRDALDR